MHLRQHGYQPGRELYLMAAPCPGCGHVRKYDLWDVHAHGIVFKCPVCPRTKRLTVKELIVLAKRDCSRLHWPEPRFLIEKRLGEGFQMVAVGGCFQLRLLLPRCPGCTYAGPRVYFLRDVFDVGPLFACPDCQGECSLHVEELIPYALEVRRRVGGPVPVRLLSGERIVEEAEKDRRPQEAMAALREERRRRGEWDGRARELPWAG
jgi:hypothetical protein